MDKLASYLNLDLDYFSAASRYDNNIFQKYGYGKLSPSGRACYLSHYMIYKSIIDKGFHSALILEDDVDFETDITKIMTRIHRNLPAYWDTLYIGHCYEEIGKLVDDSSFANRLYESVMPSCTHAYAVSYWGARKLLEKLDPMIPVPQNNTIDLAILKKIKNNEITSYSVHPQPIIQWKTKDNPSDIPESLSPHFSLKNSTLYLLGYT
ncbi:28891_t:CDS:1 [Dentiscutata erythropus]|uniref:28891_t:CDS:1 n=1 Tax=Dentiscutata erythropus TaxID=1348616 RepID=A0A9N8ZD72_9GLOM|nr:28891_t:CDS:1 [Dentiscutata erythropus]